MHDLLKWDLIRTVTDVFIPLSYFSVMLISLLPFQIKIVNLMALIWPAVFYICCLPPFSLLLSKRQKQDSFTRATNCSELHTSHSLEYRCSLLSNWVSLSALQFCVYKLFKYGPDPASPIQKQYISKNRRTVSDASISCHIAKQQHRSTLYFSTLIKTSERKLLLVTPDNYDLQNHSELKPIRQSFSFMRIIKDAGSYPV